MTAYERIIHTYKSFISQQAPALCQHRLFRLKRDTCIRLPSLLSHPILLPLPPFLFPPRRHHLIWPITFQVLLPPLSPPFPIVRTLVLRMDPYTSMSSPLVCSTLVQLREIQLASICTNLV